MDDVTAIFIVASVLVALLLLVGVAGAVIYTRRDDVTPDIDLNQVVRSLDDEVAHK